MKQLAAIGHRQRIPTGLEDAPRGVVRRDQEEAPGRAEDRAPAPAAQRLSYLLWCLAPGSCQVGYKPVSA